MAKKSTPFTEAWLLEKNYTKTADGSFIPPKKVFHNKIIGEPILMQKVNNSPDFVITATQTGWFIPYQTPSKKNSRLNMARGKRVISIPSNKYREYVTVTKKYWEVFGKEFKNTIIALDLKFPLNIEMTFIRKTNQLVDYFGPGESVFDLMTDHGWWEDDNRRFGKPFFGDMEVDKNNPGVRIKILLK